MYAAELRPRAKPGYVHSLSCDPVEFSQDLGRANLTLASTQNRRLLASRPTSELQSPPADALYIAGVHFVLRGKNAGNFELLSLISKSHATDMSVPGGGTILCSSLYDICCLLSYKFQE